jgi:hypothetical protein
MRRLSAAVPGRLVQLAVLVLSAALLNCTSVKADDLVGSWTMTEASRQYLPAELGTVTPRLTLNSDGTFTTVEFPGARRIGSTWVVGALSARGTWSILPTDGRDRVELHFVEEGYGDQLFISDWSTDGPGSPTMLYKFDGDPDAVRRILFTR